MPKRKQVITAELHAHAQQLLEFARLHDVGFVVMLIDKDKSLNVVTNLSPEQKLVVAEGWVGQPVSHSLHGPGGKG